VANDCPDDDAVISSLPDAAQPLRSGGEYRRASSLSCAAAELCTSSLRLDKECLPFWAGGEPGQSAFVLFAASGPTAHTRKWFLHE
jgi:hypothetical protein